MSIITNTCLTRELSLRDLKIAELKTKSEQTVVVSPGNITAGTLPSNVTVGASQVTDLCTAVAACGGGGSSSVLANDVIGLDAYIANYLASNPPAAVSNQGKIIMLSSYGTAFGGYYINNSANIDYGLSKYGFITTLPIGTQINVNGGVVTVLARNNVSTINGDLRADSKIRTVLSSTNQDLGIEIYYNAI